MHCLNVLVDTGFLKEEMLSRRGSHLSDYPDRAEHVSTFTRDEDYKEDEFEGMLNENNKDSSHKPILDECFRLDKLEEGVSCSSRDEDHKKTGISRIKPRSILNNHL